MVFVGAIGLVYLLLYVVGAAIGVLVFVLYAFGELAQLLPRGKRVALPKRSRLP